MDDNDETRIFDRVEPDERLVAARSDGLSPDRNPTREAAARIVGRRSRLRLAPISELMATMHEGHRY